MCQGNILKIPAITFFCEMPLISQTNLPLYNLLSLTLDCATAAYLFSNLNFCDIFQLFNSSVAEFENLFVFLVRGSTFHVSIHTHAKPLTW